MARPKKTTTEKKPTKSKASPNTIRHRTQKAKDAAYKAAIDQAKLISGNRLAYIIGDKNPYLYMALSDGALNLRIYKYAAKADEDGNLIEKWYPTPYYASSIERAVRIAETDAQRDHPRRRKTDNLVAGTDEILAAIAEMEKSLQNVGNLADMKE